MYDANNPVIVIANGEFPTHEIPINYLKNCNHIICADGAADKIKEFGLEPNVVIGDFDGLFCDSALLDLKSLPHPLSWVLGRSVLASSSPFPGPWVFRRWLEFLLVFGVFPSPLIRPPFLIYRTWLKLGSGVGWRCANCHFRGAGREPREENFGAT